MIQNGDIYYRCLVDMQPALSSQNIGDIMRVVEYEEQCLSGEETSEMAVVDCRVGKKGCRPIKTSKVRKNWSIPPMLYGLMDFGAIEVGAFGSLGEWYHKNKVH